VTSRLVICWLSCSMHGVSKSGESVAEVWHPFSFPKPNMYNVATIVLEKCSLQIKNHLSGHPKPSPPTRLEITGRIPRCSLTLGCIASPPQITIKPCRRTQLRLHFDVPLNRWFPVVENLARVLGLHKMPSRPKSARTRLHTSAISCNVR